MGFASADVGGDDEVEIRVNTGAWNQELVMGLVVDVTNGDEAPIGWQVHSIIKDATGFDLVIIPNDTEESVHDSENMTVEVEFLWR